MLSRRAGLSAIAGLSRCLPVKAVKLVRF